LPGRGKTLPRGKAPYFAIVENVVPAQMLMFFDPWALPLVLLGSMAIAWMQNGSAAVRSAISIIPAIWVRRGRDIAYNARLAMVRVEERVARNGPNHADRISPDTHFVSALADILANAPDKAHYAQAVTDYRTRLNQQRSAASGYWHDIAELAPAIGMIGTVVGLILMFDGIESANAIGQAMAVCLLTSLYGLLLAHIIAGPIARRIELFTAYEARWHDEVARRFDMLANTHLHNRAVILTLSNKGQKPVQPIGRKHHKTKLDTKL
jgi:chemotaxis protein MotA